VYSVLRLHIDCQDYYQITHDNVLVSLQGAASVPLICFFYGLPSFFCTAVCIACSQLEKLRARLLAIKQEKGTAKQDSATDCEQKEGKGQIYICQEMFSLMQEQLKECVSLHRLILE